MSMKTEEILVALARLRAEVPEDWQIPILLMALGASAFVKAGLSGNVDPIEALEGYWEPGGELTDDGLMFAGTSIAACFRTAEMKFAREAEEN